MSHERQQFQNLELILNNVPGPEHRAYLRTAIAELLGLGFTHSNERGWVAPPNLAAMELLKQAHDEAGKASLITNAPFGLPSDIAAPADPTAFNDISSDARSVTITRQFSADFPGIAGIIAERMRQVEAEGFTSAHDDAHAEGQLALAAACYARHAGTPDWIRGTLDGLAAKGHTPPHWPWAASWWKPKDRRTDLIRAGALIVAEIERLDRASSKAGEA